MADTPAAAKRLKDFIEAAIAKLQRGGPIRPRPSVADPLRCWPLEVCEEYVGRLAPEERDRLVSIIDKMLA